MTRQRGRTSTHIVLERSISSNNLSLQKVLVRLKAVGMDYHIGRKLSSTLEDHRMLLDLSRLVVGQLDIVPTQGRAAIQRVSTDLRLESESNALLTYIPSQRYDACTLPGSCSHRGSEDHDTLAVHTAQHIRGTPEHSAHVRPCHTCDPTVGSATP